MNNSQILKLSSEIYNLLVILENYCKQKSDIEEINCISTQIELLLQKSDILNYILLNNK